MSIESFYKARRHELNNEWGPAAYYYERAGYRRDAAICRQIQTTIQKGDIFRQMVKDKLKEEGLPEDISVCPKLNTILRESYERCFNRPQ